MISFLPHPPVLSPPLSSLLLFHPSFPLPPPPPSPPPPFFTPPLLSSPPSSLLLSNPHLLLYPSFFTPPSLSSLPPSFSIDLWILLTVNIIVAIVGAITVTGERGQALTTMGVSILYWVLFIPGSFCCWFLPAYHAFK